MPEMNPLTLGETPEEFIEQDDGSVIIPDEAPVAESGADFYENLAEVLDEEDLDKISSRLIEAIDNDKKAREKRDKQQADGLRRTGLGQDAPGGATFEGASSVVHPVLAEVTIDFASSAMKELYPPDGPVKTKTFKADEARLERAERKRDFMNWQLTTQMKEYRDELEQLLTQLPMGGSQFQKFWYDERLKRPVSEFVPVDAILLPFASSNFYTSPRATHVLSLTKFEFDRRVESGLYRDIETLTGASEDVEKTTSELANDKIEGKDGEAYDEDGLRQFYEVYAHESPEDTLRTGENAPYIITIDAFSEKVVGFYRNWEEIDPLQEKLDWFVEWKFIPWRGAYAIGLPHLIGGLSGALTGALRAILDAAHISNSQTAVKLKGGRVQGQTTAIDATQIVEIEAPPGTTDIRQVMMPLPYPGPSPVLFQMLGFLTETAKGVASTAEEKISEASNQMPVGTAMALIEQGSKVFSAIHARAHNSQAKALQILDRINRTFKPDLARVVEDGGPEMQPDDFEGPSDVQPVSDPNIFSEAQRFAQLQGIDQLVATSPQLNWGHQEIKRRALRLMHVDNPDAILPPAPKPVTADPVQENFVAMGGLPILANPQQDHQAHIQGHLMFILAQGNNPLANGQTLGAILAHIEQHLNFLYVTQTQQAAQMVAIQAQAAGAMLSPDAIVAQAQMQVLQQAQPMFQMLAQAQQVVQSKTPPPPMPPEVQASLQIATMDNERKKAIDQATLQMKAQSEAQAAQAEAAMFQAKEQREQARMFMEQAQQAFDQRLAMLEAQGNQQNEQLRAQVEMMKNDRDNEQKQLTELLKNHEDNQTQLMIAEMSKRFDSMQQSLAAPQGEGQVPTQPDFAPQLEEMKKLLGDIHQAKTNDALGAVVSGLTATIESINRPRTKTFIHDQKGRPIGIQEE